MLTSPRGRARRGRWPREAYALLGLLALQAAAACFFLIDSIIDLSMGRHSDLTHNLAELGAVVALVAGVAFLTREIRRMVHRNVRMEGQLRAARGAFHEVMVNHFAEWGLTPSERDVALLSIKGLAIAEARSTREGTVKAQLNAIYGKAGVAGRHQLLGLFVDELVDGPQPEAAQGAPDQA